MSSVRAYHDEAIRAAQLAMAALQQGKQQEHQALMQEATLAETRAANLVPDEKASEPTRAILYRSAASFAYQAGEYAEAERLLFRGLAGYPPADVKEQLLDIQQMVYAAMGEGAETGDANGRKTQQIVTALYENGVLRPTTSLTLAESQLVAIQILPVPVGATG